MVNLKIEEIINKSGNSFHCKVINYLKEKGWETLVSPYYMDGATNKPREIDLIAEKVFTNQGQRGGSPSAIVIKLFIECKYISQANVLWFSEKDHVSAKQWVDSNTSPLLEESFTDHHHHYIDSGYRKVAKLFAGESKQNTENEVIYKALNQSLNAMVYLRGRGPSRKSREQIGVPYQILRIIEMPVILCDDFANFYRVDMEDLGDPKSIDANFQLEVNYAYIDQDKSHKAEYFLIDIVAFDKLDNFLDVLKEDSNVMFSTFS